MLRTTRYIERAARLLAVVALTACTDPTGPGARPGFFGLRQYFDSPFVWQSLLQRENVLPSDFCPPFAASALPVTRRAISGTSASIALPTTAIAVPFAKDSGVVYRIPGEGLIGMAYDLNVVTRLDFSDGRSRNAISSFPLESNCAVNVDGRPARLFVTIVPPFSPADSTASTPITFTRSMFLITTTPTGRLVNITIEGATVTNVAFQPPSIDDRNFAIGRLLSHVASITW